MSISETVFVICSVLNVFVLILTFLIYINIISIKTQVNQMYVGMATILTKLFGLEQITGKIGNSFTEFIKMTEGIVDRMSDMNEPRIYRTGDGKYSARSIDELIGKIKSAGDESEYFSDDELDKLRNLFEDDTDDSFDDEEQ